ncbi:hypothetical protein Enr13x_04490 [Stieleria neptunia]|uniref:Uncharacterized protein n=1 Tax=Stieleria neptunia TaxID=2527979 RepID=A0A518HIN2_9BACT|nr:hypothetical protein [Stieleria neptunia]QDV40640.1 hypothetical protein Enr13x_04490 [Stieleria neptunia]
MRDDQNETSAAATGAGAVLAGVLSLFARSADDVARMGVHCVDDVGRACVTSVDDVGSIMARSGDDVFRQVDDFYAVNYLDDLRVQTTPVRIEAAANDETILVDLGRGAADIAVDVIQLANDDER